MFTKKEFIKGKLTKEARSLKESSKGKLPKGRSLRRVHKERALSGKAPTRNTLSKEGYTKKEFSKGMLPKGVPVLF